MVGLSGQVWILCAIAFLAGSGLTWLVFVHRPRQPPPQPLPATTEMAPWAPEREAEQPVPPAAPPVAAPAAEPALANLDPHGAETSCRHAGSAAAGALDRLGVGGPRSGEGAHSARSDRADRSDCEPDLARRIPAQGGVPDAVPGVPEQGGPVDDPAR